MSSLNLNDFRDQYLVAARTQLQAVDLSTADNKTLILTGALFNALDKVANTPLIGKETLSLFNTMTGAEIDVWLTDASHRTVWQRLCSDEIKTVQTALQDDLLRPRLLASSIAWADIMASSALQTWFTGKAAYLAPYIAAIPSCLSLTTTTRSMMDRFSSNQPAMAVIVADARWLAAINASPSAQDSMAGTTVALRELAKSAAGMTALVNKLTSIMQYLFADQTAAIDGWATVSAEIAAGRTAMAVTLFDTALIRSTLHGNSAINTALGNGGSALYQWLFSNRMTVVQKTYTAALQSTQTSASLPGKFLLLAMTGTTSNAGSSFFYLGVGSSAAYINKGSGYVTLTTSHKQLSAQNNPIYYTDVNDGSQFLMSFGYLVI